MTEMPPVFEIAEAVISTVQKPTPEVIISDVELALKLVKQLRADLAGVHPSVMDIVKKLF